MKRIKVGDFVEIKFGAWKGEIAEVIAECRFEDDVFSVEVEQFDYEPVRVKVHASNLRKLRPSEAAEFVGGLEARFVDNLEANWEFIQQQGRERRKAGLSEAIFGSVTERDCQSPNVVLDKPQYDPTIKKAKSVCVRDPNTGNIIKVAFGDPDMPVRAHDPERRKAFRSRHNCDNPGPRTKARYWACKDW